MERVRVRRFMRRAAGFIIKSRTATHVLGFPEDDARRLLRQFKIEGLVTPTDDHWEATAKGHALAMATAACPWRIDKIMRRLGSGTTVPAPTRTNRNLLGM